MVAVLVSTFAVLTDATDRHGVPTALGADPGRTRISLVLTSPDAPPGEVVTVVDEALAAVLGVPVVSEVQVSSQMYDVARPGAFPGHVYLDRRDGVADAAVIVDGRWPDAEETAAGTPDDPLPVAAPASGAVRLGVGLGDTWRLAAQGGGTDVVVRVVGLYEVPDPSDGHWSQDLLSGAGYEPNYPVALSGGFLRTEAVGPLVVAAEVADTDAFAVRRMIIRADPDLSGVTAARLPALRAGAGRLADDIGYRLDGLVADVTVSSRLSATLRETATGIVVTRAGTGVAAVLLLVVAVAALLQTARLIAEARSAEHDLMRARGASRGQLFAAVATEAAMLGVVVAALAPPLAVPMVRALGGPPAAALPPDLPDAIRSLPWTAWGAGVLVGVLLVLVSTVPLLRAPSTFVEAAQARGRRARRGSLARLAADLAAVGAAVLGWAQLRAYGGPVVGSGADLAADPLLIAGPALLLLAAVLVGVRVLPLAGHLLERAARRGRGLVVPLAGWDLGRRAHHAGAAVLLLAVAVSAATFGLTQRATWERSQEDQAAFALGAPAVVVDAGRSGAGAGGLDVAGGDPQPVLRDRGTMSGRGGGGGSGGAVVDVVAATSLARAGLHHDRVAREGGADVAALPAAPPTEGAVDLGADAIGVSATVRIEGPALPDGTVLALRLVLEDGAGALSTLDLGLYPLIAAATGSHEVEVSELLPDVRLPVGLEPQASAEALAARAAERVASPRIVGLQTVVVAIDPQLRWEPGLTYDVQVTLADLTVLRPAADVTEVDPADWASELGGDVIGVIREPVDLDTTGWSFVGPGGGGAVDPITPAAGMLWVRQIGLVQFLPDTPSVRSVVAWEPTGAVPTVVTADLVERVSDAPDRGYDLRVGGVVLTTTVVHGVVSHVPSTTGRAAVVADYTTLVRAMVEGGAAGRWLDEWWVDPPDVNAYADALATDGVGRPPAERATTIGSATTALLEHPLGVAVPVVLALLALGGALVAAVGFAVHTAVTVRERDLELAQLRAVGLSRGRLTTAVGLESAILAGLGVTLGVGAGVGVAAVVGRFLVVGAAGDPPLPSVELVVPSTVAWLALGLIALVAALTVTVAAGQRTADPAALLRAGEAR